MGGGVLILSGSGRYADPWHPYPRTSMALASIAEEAGLDGVEIAEDIDRRLSDLDGISVLVVNAGDPRRNLRDGDEPPNTAVIAVARAALDRYLDSGGAVLALHAAAASLPDYPRFTRAIGAEWVHGRSWHPPLGMLELVIAHEASDHPVVRGLSSLQLEDEGYADLEIDPQARVLAVHELDGLRHPLILERTDAAGRSLYDALGHDERAYEHSAHRDILIRAFRRLGESSG